jgi:hypothetical protein
MQKNIVSETNFVPVKRVLDIINSCETEEQLKSCLRLMNNYVRMIKSNGVVNSELVKKRLLKEYKQKKFQLTMISEYMQRHQTEHFNEIVGMTAQQKLKRMHQVQKLLHR